MGYPTIYDGFIFVEGEELYERYLGKVESDLSFNFGAQLKNLNDVKADLVQKARSIGANAIIDFSYGQKSRWLAIDDVAFWGKGKAVILSADVLEKIKQKIAQRT